MAEPRKRSSRRQTIEPLNYAEAALAPALKGMTSFLDLSPEDVRRGNFEGLVVRKTAAGDANKVPDETFPGGVWVTKVENSNMQDFGDHASLSDDLASPGDDTYPLSGKIAGLRASLRVAEYVSAPGVVLGPETIDRLDDALPAVTPAVQRRAIKLRTGTATANGPASISAFDIDRHSEIDRVTVYVSSPARATLDLGAQDSSLSSLVPSRGRSAVRRCLLAQDGHSLGEEAIYQLLWRTGTPESTDPNDSRTTQMGAAEIGLKINMAKKNVRQNIARLFEKLAIEIVEDFATMTSQARLYRVFSSRQILERRRAAGMEYVLRNKGVVFCERNGSVVMTSPAYETCPDGALVVRPARPKRRRKRLKEAAFSANAPGSQRWDVSGGTHTELEIVLEALNQYTSVKESLAEQLIQDCRRMRADARSDEIVFLIHEKFSLPRSTRDLASLTGLILAVIPQAFAGDSLDELRRRLNRRVSLAAEDAERVRRSTSELNEWMMRERDELIRVASDASIPEEIRSKAEWQLRQRDWGSMSYQN